MKNPHLAIIAACCCGAFLALSPALTEAQMPSIEAISTPDQSTAITLYLQDKGSATNEEWEKLGGARIVRNVTVPTLTPVLPAADKANGSAVIIAPGGAFLMLSIDTEGFQFAHWLADHGIAAFVLKYRLNPSARDANAYLSSLMTFMENAAVHSPLVLSTPSDSLKDAQTAVELVRLRAKEWNIDSARVGFVGFSAGAALAQAVALESLPAARPNFIGSIYGPLEGRKVNRNAPPMFAAVASDDALFGRGDFDLISQWRRAGLPVEFHYFETGGHGFGMSEQGKSSDLWAAEFLLWLKSRGVLNRDSATEREIRSKH